MDRASRLGSGAMALVAALGLGISEALGFGYTHTNVASYPKP